MSVSPLTPAPEFAPGDRVYGVHTGRQGRVTRVRDDGCVWVEFDDGSEEDWCPPKLFASLGPASPTAPAVPTPECDALFETGCCLCGGSVSLTEFFSEQFAAFHGLKFCSDCHKRHGMARGVADEITRRKAAGKRVEKTAPETWPCPACGNSVAHGTWCPSCVERWQPAAPEQTPTETGAHESPGTGHDRVAPSGGDSGHPTAPERTIDPYENDGLRPAECDIAECSEPLNAMTRTERIAALSASDNPLDRLAAKRARHVRELGRELERPSVRAPWDWEPPEDFEVCK